MSNVFYFMTCFHFICQMALAKDQEEFPPLVKQSKSQTETAKLSKPTDSVEVSTKNVSFKSIAAQLR